VNVYVKNVDSEKLTVTFNPREVNFEYGDQKLVLEPLPKDIDTEKSNFRIMKMKVEVGLVKKIAGRWHAITGEEDESVKIVPLEPSTSSSPKPKKNWDGITTSILTNEKEKTTNEDPNVGGDAAANEMFAKLYADADEDVKKAMIKSYTESNGTSLSMNWDEVKKAKVEPYKSKYDD